MMRSSLLLLALALSAGACTDKDGTGDTNDSDTGVDAVFDGIGIGVNTVSLGLGETIQLSPVATYSDGSTQDISAAATYRVVNASVAEVSDAGILTGLAEGSTELEIAYQGFDLTVDVQVSASTLAGDVTFAGFPVEGLPVTLVGTSEEATTDASGRYSFDGVAPGDYDVTVVLPYTERAQDDVVDVSLSSGDSQTADLAIESTGYPMGPDLYESNDLPGTAGAITVGTLQYHTLWASPDDIIDGGDQDYFRVTVQEGVEYDFFTAGLCATCDTILTLFEADGITPITESDDDLYLESRVQFTAAADGDLVFRVEPYDTFIGVAAYFVGVTPHVDIDDDGAVAFKDCDDTDPDVYPYANDTPGNGVDEDCVGGDAPAEDVNEPNNERTAATSLPVTNITIGEGILARAVPVVGALSGTSDAPDVDWYSVSVPANSKMYLETGAFSVSDSGGNQVGSTLYDSDGETMVDQWVNDTNAARTMYVRFEGYGYVSMWMYAYSVGIDEDGDGFYPQDWADDRDCSEGDASRGADACSAD